MESITVRLGSRIYGRSFDNLECKPNRRIKLCDNAAFGG
jgi:hypothetical protein